MRADAGPRAQRARAPPLGGGSATLDGTFREGLNSSVRPENVAIGLEWRRSVVSPLDWRWCENQAGALEGEALGFMASAEGFDRRVYLKPGTASAPDLALIAAREKIVSDLAHDLSLPVPPAQLAIRRDAADGCPKHVVVSLVMYPVQWPWEQVRYLQVDDSPQGLALAKVLGDCAGMLAFDTWVDQEDHADHPSNVVWGYDTARPGVSELIFLDYARALGFNGKWEAEGWKTVAAAPFPRLLKDTLVPAALQAVVDKIEKFPDDRIIEIVSRIPDVFMHPKQRELVAGALVYRKGLVRSAIGRHL
jgi:hypothetical protein